MDIQAPKPVSSVAASPAGERGKSASTPVNGGKDLPRDLVPQRVERKRLYPRRLRFGSMVLVGGEGFRRRHVFIMCSRLYLSQELGIKQEHGKGSCPMNLDLVMHLHYLYQTYLGERTWLSLRQRRL